VPTNQEFYDLAIQQASPLQNLFRLGLTNRANEDAVPCPKAGAVHFLPTILVPFLAAGIIWANSRKSEYITGVNDGAIAH